MALQSDHVLLLLSVNHLFKKKNFGHDIVYSETYVNSKEFSDIKSLAERVSQEVMMHNLVCVDFEMPNGTENTKKKFSLIDDAIKEVISYASYHSLNLVVLTSPQESLCYAAIKDRPMP